MRKPWLHPHLAQAWPEADAVLCLDGSGFPKQGEHSCGVTPQSCRRLGQVANGQLGRFASEASGFGHTWVEAALLLPAAWAAEAARRTATGVPPAVEDRAPWPLALDVWDRGRGALPHRWVVADAEFGRVQAFRAGRRERQERFVVDVRADWRCRDLQAAVPSRRGPTGRMPTPARPTPAPAWAAQPERVGQPLTVRDGEPGPLRVDAAETWVETYEHNPRVGPRERLGVIRTVGGTAAPTWSTLSNADATVAWAELVGAHAQRHWQEADFQRGKTEIGLAHSAVRGGVGWPHHLTLSRLALWFLTWEHRQEKKKTPGWTVSGLRDALRRRWAWQRFSPAQIVTELNAVLRRTAEARIDHWHAQGLEAPPRSERCPRHARPVERTPPEGCPAGQTLQ